MGANTTEAMMRTFFSVTVPDPKRRSARVETRGLMGLEGEEERAQECVCGAQTCEQCPLNNDGEPFAPGLALPCQR